MPLTVGVVQQGLEASINEAAKRAGRNLKIDLGVSSRSIGSLSQPLGKITGQADQFTKSMEAANARVLAFGASVGVLSAITRGFKEIVSTTITVEKSLADINSVLGANSTQLNKFKNDIFSIAKETGNSFQTVSDAALELSRQGLKSDEVLRRLKDSMILSRLSGIDAASAVEGLTAAVNSFSKEGLTTSQVLNKIAKTAADYSVSERDLIEGFKRSASVAQQAGVSIDELGGIITAVQQKTARGGAVIGNAFKTIFTRIQRPESLQALQDIGAAVTDVSTGGILPATKLIENLAQQMNKLNDIQRADITEKIGGGFQIGPLLAALDDLNSKTSVYKGATESMATAGSEAYSRNAALSKILAASINEATVNLQELANTLGEIGVTDSLKNMLSFFNSFVSNVKDILQGEGFGSDFARGIVKGISAVLSGPGLLIFGAIIGKLLINFVQFGATALKTFFNIGSAAKEIGAIQSTIASTLLNNKAIQTQILALEGDRVSQAQFFTVALNTQLATMERMRTIAAAIAPAVYGGTTGAGKPRAAGGYMPSVMAEASDINKGVGGARPSDRPVVISNFAFGGGRKGTMIAHTGEHIVPNYGGGGGSAIFNRNMTASMGLPAGAQKIRGALGFIPNFAVSIKDATTQSQFESLYSQPRYAKNAAEDAIRYEGTARGLAAAKASQKIQAGKAQKQSSTLYIDAQNDLGGIGVVSISGPKNGSTTERITGGSFVGGAKQFVDKIAGEGRFTAVEMSNIELRNLEGLQNLGQGDFRQKVKNRFTTPLYELAGDILPNVFNGNDAASYSDKLQKQLKDPALFSDAVLGGIFESAVRMSTKSVKQIEAFDTSDDKKPFDFEEGGAADKKFKEAFGFQNALYKADAKKTAEKGTGGSISSVISKSLRDSGTQAKIISKKLAKNAASGFIPNFASPDYILNTLKRIKDGTSGFSKTEQEAFLKKFGATGGTGNGISLQQVFDRLDSDPSVSPFINKAYSAAGATASTSQVFKEFEKQTKLNPTPLRNIVKGKGFIPNFVDLTKTEGFTENQRKRSYKARTYRNASGIIGDLFKTLPEKFFSDGVLGDAGQGIETDGIFNAIKNSALYASSFAGPKAMNLVTEAEKYGLKVSKGLQKKLSQLVVKGASKIKGYAGGYIPNFADPLREAISREVGAGVNPSQVYVDQHNSLKSPMNPSGLMVANRRDEPSGGYQGINRAKKEGANLQTYGAAGGFIPNYANFGTGTMTRAAGTSSGVSSTTTPATTVAPSEAPAKASRDFLGTIFAVQAGLTALSGATSGATNAVAKYTNIVTDSIGTGTSLLFAFQGLATALPAFGALLGPIGVAVAGLTAAWQIGTKIYYENSGINKILATSLSRVGDAAAKASINLTNLSKERQLEVKESAKKFITEQSKTGNMVNPLESNDFFTRFAAATTEGGFGTGMSIPTPVSNVKVEQTVGFSSDPSGLMAERLQNLTEEAIGAGVPLNNLAEVFAKIRDNGSYTQEELDSLSLTFARFIDKVAKVDTELRKATGSSMPQGKKLAGMNKEEFITELNQGQLGFAPLRKILSVSGKTDTKAQDDEIKRRYDELQATKQSAQEQEDQRIDGLNIKYKKSLEIIKSEANLRKLNLDIEDKISGKNGVNERTQEALLQVAKDTNLTEIERANKIEDINNQSEKQLKLLDFQKTKARELQDSFTNLFDALGETDAAGRSNFIFDKIRKQSAQEQGKISQGILGGDTKPFEDFLSTLDLSAAESSAIKDTLLNWYKNLALSTDELAKQGKLNDKSLKDARDRIAAQKETNDLLKKNSFEAQRQIDYAGDLNKLKIQTQSPQELALRKELNILNQPTGKENYSQQIQIDARKSEIEKILQPIENSKSREAISLQYAQEAKNKIIEKFSIGKETPQIDDFKLKLKDINSLSELQVNYGTEYKDIIENQNSLSAIALNNLEQQIAAQIKLGDYTSRRAAAQKEGKLFQFGFGEGMTELQKETDAFGETLGKRIPSLFADNMASAMEAIIMKGESFGDSLKAAASSFLSEITKANIKNLAGQFTIGTSNLGSAIGTLFKASGGAITGGSGNKDDVPAMLMGGEYVMNKKAVSKYGKSFMNALNNGSISGFADGGAVIRSGGLGSSVSSRPNLKDIPIQSGINGFEMPGYYGAGSISGTRDLLSYATQETTSGMNDIIGGSNNSAYINLEGQSANLTRFGRTNGPMAQAIAESKAQAFDLYGQELNRKAEMAKQEKERKKELNKSLRVGLLTAIGTSVASAGLNSAMNGFKLGAESAGADATLLDKFKAGSKGALFGQTINGETFGGLKNLVTGNFSKSQVGSITDYKSFKNNEFLKTPAGKAYIADQYSSLFTPTESSIMTEDLSKLPKLATGGSIPYSSGIDTVPAMLSGGEFVMNSAATQRIGAGNLNNLNSGITEPTDSKELNDKLILKLDELIKITKENALSSDSSVVVNVSKEESNGPNSSASSQDNALKTKIKAAVIQILQDEKRLGGVLRRA